MRIIVLAWLAKTGQRGNGIKGEGLVFQTKFDIKIHGSEIEPLNTAQLPCPLCSMKVVPTFIIADKPGIYLNKLSILYH